MRRTLARWGPVALTVGLGAAPVALRAPAEVVVVRYPSGRVQSETRYRNGALDGTSRGWYENGAPRFVLHYANGLSDGEQRRWYPNGQPLTVLHHRAGHEVGWQRMWSRDGAIRSNYVIRGGKRYGLLGAMGCTGKKRPAEGATP